MKRIHRNAEAEPSAAAAAPATGKPALRTGARLRPTREASDKRIRELEILVSQLQEANEKLVAAKLAVSHLAHHDFLTNLPNRSQLMERLTHAIAIASRHERRLAVIFMDLDRFKTINDSLGHSMGDRLLQSVSQRLRHSVRTSDTVCRQGGDEFVILLSQIEHDEDAAKIARKILAALSTPHEIGDTALYVGCSLGISVYPADGADADTLLRHADTAMYFAKHHGRNQYQFFRQEMNRHAMERQFIENNLRHALDCGQFVLHYQPKIDLAGGTISGVEALIRWHHPQRGLVAPKQFISIAEDCGLIVAIDDWVLLQACRQARRWLEDGLSFGRIAVNLSPMEFHRDDIVTRIRRALDTAGLDGRHLEIELTEGVFLKDTNSAVAMLHQLRAIGLRIAIDDFGTGYSSLGYLRRLPVDVLKIDQSFLHNISKDPEAAPILKAVIDIGVALQQRVIAEGVETEEQYLYLRRNRCMEGQGFFFSRPVAVEHCTSLLGKRDLRSGGKA